MFAGTPAAAVPSLERLAASGARRRRRGHPSGGTARPQAGAHAVARRRGGRAARHPRDRGRRLDADATAAIAALRPTSASSSRTAGSCGSRCSRRPRHGWINLHFSLLPAWRGAAPVQHALIAGDAETGASVFRLVPELDAGDVYGMRSRDRRRTTPPARCSTSSRSTGRTCSPTWSTASPPARPSPRRRPARRRSRRSSASTTPGSTGARRPTRTQPIPGRDARARRLDDHRRPAAEGARPRGRAGCRSGRARRLELVGRRLLVGTGTTPLELRRVQPAGRTRDGGGRLVARRRTRRRGGAMSGQGGGGRRQAPRGGRRPAQGEHISPARLVAFEVLAAVRERRGVRQPPAAGAHPSRRADPADAAFATELTYGTLRRQGYYDHVIELAAGRPTRRSTRRCSTSCASERTSCSPPACPRTPPSTSRLRSPAASRPRRRDSPMPCCAPSHERRPRRGASSWPRAPRARTTDCRASRATRPGSSAPCACPRARGPGRRAGATCSRPTTRRRA